MSSRPVSLRAGIHTIVIGFTMDQIHKILKSSLAKKGLLGAAISAEICFWAGKWGKARFVPISFSRGVLKVSVDSPIVSSELQIQEEDLVNFINGKMERELVKKVRILNGR